MRDPQAISASRLVKCVVSLAVYFASELRETWLRLAGQKPHGKCVILYYHSVPDEQRRQFAWQMEQLLRHAKPASLRDELTLAAGARYAAVTFDDALQNLIANALPELESRGIPATIFAISGAMGRTFGAPEYLEAVMTREELQSLPEDWITIGSHTVTHPFLPAIRPEAAWQELTESRAQLSELLRRDITLFSFPFGGYNHELIKLCRQAGYRRVFTTQPRLASNKPEEFAVGRIRVDPSDWRLEFLLKLAGAYRWLPWAFGMKRRLRSSRWFSKLRLRKTPLPEITIPRATIQ